MPTFFKDIFQRRFLSLLLLGFTSGLPLALTLSTLQAWYTKAGVSIMGIGLLSLVGQPYVYKFIWSPLMDNLIPPFLGRRRGWIFICQIALIICIGSMAFFDPTVSPILLASVAMAVAFCSASQDISISAYLVDICPEEKKRGFGAACYVSGYRIAIIISGAMALILAQHIGFRMTYFCMAIVMLLVTTFTFIAPEPDAVKITHTFKEAIIEPFREFFQRNGKGIAIYLLLVLLLYKLGDAFLLSFNTTFLLRGLHFSLTDIALANKIFGLAAGFLGGIIGGLWMTRISMYRALLVFGVVQALSNLSYVVLAVVGHNLGMMMSAVFIENFCSGMGSTAFVAFTMSLCNQRFSASQYALFNALETVGRVYIGPIAGALLTTVSWVSFYWISFALAWPVIILIVLGRKVFVNFNQDTNTNNALDKKL